MRRTFALIAALSMAAVFQVGIAHAASTPSRPLAPRAVPGNAKVTLGWAVPSTNGGKPVDKYRVQRATSSGGPWASIAYPRSTARAFTATELKNGKRYYFRVAAHNVVGWSTPSTTVSTVPRTVPSGPQNPSATPGEGSATVVWQAPVSNGGAPIDFYRVQSRVTGTTSWANAATTGDAATRQLVVPGLSPGVTYDFRIRAHNVAGFGGAAGPVTATPPAPATQPKVVGAQATSATSVAVTFDHPIDPASVVADSFTADNGLTFSAASVSDKVVTLTSSTQQTDLTYIVTAPSSVLDTTGVALDPSAREATFAGYSPPPAPPKVVGAQANSATSVAVTFDHAIDPATVVAASFTADGGLTFSAASVSGTVVTLTSSAMQGNFLYTVTASTTVLDTNGVGVDPSARTASFAYLPPPPP